MTTLLLLTLTLQDDPDILLLQSRNVQDRIAAAQILGARRVVPAIPALIDALKDEPPVQEAAHQALVKITRVDTVKPTYEDWKTWWQTDGIKLLANLAGTGRAITSDVENELARIREVIRTLQSWNDKMWVVLAAFSVIFLLALIYFSGHLASKLKEWKDIMKQADVFLRESEEVTKRTDRIIDELDAKKTDLVDFFNKLKEDSQSDLERFADNLENNAEGRMRTETRELRQTCEKELTQTIAGLKSAVDHELRRSATEYRARIEKELTERQQAFMSQIDIHSRFVEASFYSSQGRHEEALRVFKKLLTLKPDHHVAWTKMGDVLREMLRFDEAIEAHGRGLELAPDDSSIHYSRAQTYACMKRREPMLADLAKAFQNNGTELKDDALNDPIFKPFWNDPGFKDLAEG